MRRSLLWAAVAVAAGIGHNYATVWYCTEGAYPDLVQTGPTWLVWIINYAFFFPLLFLSHLGLGRSANLRLLFAANSVVWTATMLGLAIGSRRLLTWWWAARRRKMVQSTA